ncbi:MAG: ferredoxin [Bacilli bacterium]|nr:ferredoxin [Bacilli bacterium]
MKVKVNKNACICCGACAAVCPAVFELDDEEGVAKAIVDNVPEDQKDYVIEACEGCPTSAIETEE